MLTPRFSPTLVHVCVEVVQVLWDCTMKKPCVQHTIHVDNQRSCVCIMNVEGDLQCVALREISEANLSPSEKLWSSLHCGYYLLTSLPVSVVWAKVGIEYTVINHQYLLYVETS